MTKHRIIYQVLIIRKKEILVKFWLLRAKYLHIPIKCRIFAE
jgi:hypothetical protein